MINALSKFLFLCKTPSRNYLSQTHKNTLYRNRVKKQNLNNDKKNINYYKLVKS